MTTALVVRLTKKEIAAIDAAARKRSLTRSAYVRNVLRKETSEDKETKGVGWAEHFDRLKREGRKVDSKLVDEVIAASRSR